MMNTVSNCLKNGTEFLNLSGVPEPRISAEALLSYVLNRPRFSLYLETDRAVEETERLQFEALLTKRASRYPLQYLVKQVPFRNVTLEIGEGCLIPRPETEILVEAVLKRLHVYGAVVEVLDVGTGSGNIAISLAKEEPSWYVTGTDVSSQALRYAKKNAELNSVEDRVRLVQTDLWHDIKKEKFDIIVSNPPYLTSDELEMHIFGEEHQVLPEHFRRRTSSSPRRVLAQRRAAKYSRKKRAVPLAEKKNRFLEKRFWSRVLGSRLHNFGKLWKTKAPTCLKFPRLKLNPLRTSAR